MGFPAGDLDRRIRIERQVRGEDSPGGEETYTWALVSIVWANVRPLRGRELFAAQQVAAKVDTRFRIRWRTGITPERMRIVDDQGRGYDIMAVLEIGRRDGLEIMGVARAEEP